jgi:hypothetical protein
MHAVSKTSYTIHLWAGNVVLNRHLLPALSVSVSGQFRHDSQTYLQSQSGIHTQHPPPSKKKKSINRNLFPCLTLLCSLTDAAPSHQTPNHLGGNRNIIRRVSLKCWDSVCNQQNIKLANSAARLLI